METWNTWIASNQALVVSVGLPVFTLAITGWASFLSHRAKVSEVRLNGHVKLSEYRKENFDELLRITARLQSLFMEAATQSDIASLNPERKMERLLEVIECTNLFLLRSQASADQINNLTAHIEACCKSLISREIQLDVSRNDLGKLRVICKEILDNEWARIEGELKGRIL